MLRWHGTEAVAGHACTLWGNREVDKLVKGGACKFDAEGTVSKQEERRMTKDKLS